MTTVVKGDFIELSYTGYTNGEVFDSNREVDLKKLDPKAKVEKTFIIVGEGMVVSGLDKVLEGKQVGEEHTLSLSAKEAFGLRNPSLIRPIPLRVFTERRVVPRAGMSLVLDNNIVQIRAVSGARVIADFNNPLAGKDVSYSYRIVAKIDDVAEKTRIFFEKFLRGVPQFEVNDKVIIKGPAQMKPIIDLLGERFKALVGKELDFALVEPSKGSEKQERIQQSL